MANDRFLHVILWSGTAWKLRDDKHSQVEFREKLRWKKILMTKIIPDEVYADVHFFVRV